jgi:hypothetical protein
VRLLKFLKGKRKEKIEKRKADKSVVSLFVFEQMPQSKYGHPETSS